MESSEDIYIEIDDEQVKLPEGVFDEESFVEWYRLDRDLKAEASRISKCGIRLNMMSPINKKQIAKIKDKAEREAIEKEWKLYNKKKGNLLYLRNKVFSQIQASSTDYDKFFKNHRSEVDYKPQKDTYSTQLDKYAAQIIALFGKFYTLEQVAEILRTEFGISNLPITTLSNFRLRHIENIKEIQEEYKRDYGEIRLTHKRSRLEELNELYFERKIIYNQTKLKDDYKLLLQTIEQVKREVEGDIITINGTLDINVEVTVQSHIHQELMKGLSIRDIVVGRIAGRVGVNPVFLISRLHNSFYKKFNGFSLIDSASEVSYPSEVVYDFDRIRDLNQERKQEQLQLETIPIVDKSEEEDRINLRDNLMALIKNKQQDAKKNQEVVEKYPTKQGKQKK